MSQSVPLSPHGMERVYVLKELIVAKVLEASVKILAIRQAKFVPILLQPQIQSIIEDRDRLNPDSAYPVDSEAYSPR
jgi:hypothetical protein